MTPWSGLSVNFLCSEFLSYSFGAFYDCNESTHILTYFN